MLLWLLLMKRFVRPIPLVCLITWMVVIARTSAAPIVDDRNITMATPGDAPAMRQQLIQFLWGHSGFPTSKLPASVQRGTTNPIVGVTMTNLARVDRLIFDMGQGVRNEAFHFIPQVANGRLVIVHQGHATTLDTGANDGIAETIDALVAEGYGVLGALMPCFNSLPCPVTPSDPGGPHNDLFAQVVVPPGSGNVLKYFVEHLATSLNYLRTKSAVDGFPAYSEYDMTGVSGGGWTTVLYAAIDPTIRYSIPVSGSKPMYLRRCTPLGAGCLDAGGGVGYDGDREQMLPALYQIAGYLDLYALGAAGTGRRQVQVQIRHDGCCFGQDQYNNFNGVPGLTWNQAVRAYEEKLQNFFTGNTDQGWYRFEIDETSSGAHTISTTTRVQVILAELNGDRRPFASASASEVYVKGLDGTLWHSPPWWVSTSSPLVGSPSVIESGGTTHVFLRDPSSGLVHLSATQGSSWQSETWPGIIASDPAAILTGARLDAVAVGTDLKLWHWSKVGAASVSIERVDPNTSLVGTPVLVTSGPNRWDAFARRTDGGIQHIYWRGGASWSTEQVPGVFRGFPTAVVTTADGTLRMYARGTDDQLWEGSQPILGGSWFLAPLADYAGVPNVKISGSPSASINPSSHMVFVVSRSSGSGGLAKFEIVAHAWLYQSIARPSGSPPFGTAAFTLSPVAVPGGLFARGIEGNVWFNAFAAGWSWQAGQIY